MKRREDKELRALEEGIEDLERLHRSRLVGAELLLKDIYTHFTGGDSVMNDKNCPCGATMHFAETASFRVGGTSGGWKLLFGEWAELGESMIPLDIYVCPECGRIELVAGEETKQRLLKLSDKRTS